MRKEGRIQNFIIAAFGLTIVAMSIGFALYAQTLTIGGTETGQTATSATFKKSKWSVHYVNNSAQTTANSTLGAGTALGIESELTNVYFTAVLQKPGDVYEFTVDIVNDGTFDATLQSISMTQLTSAQDAYIDYVISYDGGTYTANTTSTTHAVAAANASLPAPTGSATGVTKTATITVTYVQPENESQLPSTQDVTVNLSAAFNYQQTT